MEANEQPGNRPLGTWGSLIAGLVVTAMMACVVMAWPAQVWLPHSKLPVGYTTQICAGKLTSLYTQFGFWWTTSYDYLRAPLPVAVSPYTSSLCAFIPWAPGLPRLGRVLYPPASALSFQQRGNTHPGGR